MRSNWRLRIFVISLMLSGCAYIDQTVTVDPYTRVAQEAIGVGKTVAIEVSDERDDKDFGRRGVSPEYGMGALIRNEQDMAEVFHGQFEEALKAKGFVIVSQNASRSVKVEIRSIRYETSTGIVTGGFHAKSAVKVIAENGGNKYEKMYRGENSKRAFFFPTADSNEMLINQSVNDLLNNVFADKELFKFLALPDTDRRKAVRKGRGPM